MYCGVLRSGIGMMDRMVERAACRLARSPDGRRIRPEYAFRLGGLARPLAVHLVGSSAHFARRKRVAYESHP